MTELMAMGVADALGALEYATGQIVAAEAGQLLALLAAADAYRVDEDNACAGAERLVRGGADGTPLIGEFLALEVGPLLGISSVAAACRLADALNLRHRHPRLFEAVVAGRVRVWQAVKVAQRCAAAGLDAEATDSVDAQLAVQLQLMPWGRIMRGLDGLIVRADAELARRRAAEAANRRCVVVSEFEDGHTQVWGRLSPADGTALDEALDAIAGQLRDGDRDRSRAAALGLLARHALGQATLPGRPDDHHVVGAAGIDGGAEPTAAWSGADGSADGEPDRSGRRRRRRAQLVVHVGASGGTSGVDLGEVCRVEGWGPLLTEQLNELLADAAVSVRPILDPAALAPVDRYEVPASMRWALEQRDHVSVFPFDTTAASRCQADHTTPYRLGVAGLTHLGNLGPLSTKAHRAKTHGGWRLTQPTPGTFVWVSPAGWSYSATAAGAIRMGRADPARGRADLDEPPTPDAPYEEEDWFPDAWVA